MVRFISKMSNRGLMILAIALLAGAPLMFYGILQYSRTYNEMKDSTFSRGRVLKTIQIEGGYFPMVRLETNQGTVRFTDRSGAQQPEFRDGEDVEIVFPQYQPQQARIYSWKRVWLIPTMITVGGILPLVIGCLAAVWAERKYKGEV